MAIQPFCKRTFIWTTISLTTAMLAACGGGSSEQDTDTGGTQPEGPETLVEYGQLKPAELTASVLRPASEAELETLIKNGLRLSVYNNSYRFFVDSLAILDLAAPVPVATAAPESAQNSEFSSTNTQVRDVDESDFVKYDGEYLYMVSHPEFIWGEDRPESSIRILATDPENAGVEEVSDIPLANEIWGEVSQLFLQANDTESTGLVTLRSTWSFRSAAEPGLDQSFSSFFPGDIQSKVQIVRYDLNDKTRPETGFSLEIDGTLHTSRKIGNTLYLVTHFSPFLPLLQYDLRNEEAVESNEDTIRDLDVTTLLPHYSIDGAAPQPLVTAGDCFVPVDLTSDIGLSSMVTVVAVDLDTNAITSAKCLNARTQGVYVSGGSLYIGGSKRVSGIALNSDTVIHKFLLDETIDYRSTAMIDGSLSWRNPSFRMDEHEDYLRVVTTTRQAGDIRHALTVLQDASDSDEMNVVATLPNADAPAAIGKPGEDIFAVRFMEDRAFIVTFERIDPLYVIDLSNPETPSIAGELEVPGFSTYLHPINDELLLGLGRNVDDVPGVKLSLFDISDSSNPQLLGEQRIGENGSWSIAEYDHRALSFLSTSDDQLRVAFPASIYDEGWREESLQLFEINGMTASAASLDVAGKIVGESNDDGRGFPIFSGTDRAILHGDAVYYVHGNEVWSAFWQSPDSASGPH